jgi:hypothetical protein
MGRKIIIDGLCPSDIIFFWHHAIIWDLVLSSKVMTMCNESINSDGKQFHPYQQNEQPLLSSNHLTQTAHG